MEHCGVWILAQQQNGAVERISYELLSRGLELAHKRNSPLGAMLFGCRISPAGLTELIDRGADLVVVMDSPQLEHFLVESYALCMLEIIKQYHPEIIIAGATSLGRTLMPYIAIKAGAGLTADCTGLDIEPETGLLLQTRPAIGGNIMATIKTPRHRPQMATVRPRSTQPAPKLPGRTGQIIQLPSPNLPYARMTYEGFTRNADSQSLADADTVVVVGRGIKKAENLPLIYDLARRLNAAVGATRDVVDRGWLSYPHQVGLSGATISPRLYIGIGLSGSIQHIAGMQTAETIVAVNTDPSAQIFKLADFGIVGDLFNVVPALAQLLQERGLHAPSR